MCSCADITICFFCLQFDSLVHLLQGYWPEYDITCSGSPDPVADVRCQSHDLHQPQGVLLPTQETSVVGGQTIHMEPPSELNFIALLGPSDPLATTAVCGERFCDPILFPIVPDTDPLSDCAHTNDITESELEKMLSPLTSNDSDFDLDCFDLESFMAV